MLLTLLRFLPDPRKSAYGGRVGRAAIWLPDRGLGFILLAFALLSLLTLSGLKDAEDLLRPALFFVLGFAIFVTLPIVFPWRILKSARVTLALYLFSTFLLLLPLFLSSEVRGVRRWILVGPFSLQPAEFFSLAVIVLLSYYFSSQFRKLRRPLVLLVAVGIILPGIALEIVQPDVSSAIVILIIFLALALASEPSPRALLLMLGILAVGGAFFAAFGMEEYQQARVLSFFFPSRDPLGYGWQRQQALIAIGSGGPFGKGVGFGSQTLLRLLPEAETDFFFAAFAEAWGFIGTALLLALFALFLRRIIAVGEKAEDNMIRFFSLGLAVKFAAATLLHIGSNIGLLPIAGLPLPFLSLGGSHLVSSFLGLGILEAMRRQ